MEFDKNIRDALRRHAAPPMSLRFSHATKLVLGALHRPGRRGAAPPEGVPSPGSDALTGLATRAELESALPRLADATQPGSTLALLVLDVYRFARINELWGDRAGDAVLAELAARLLRLPQVELVARVGADSFALVLRGDAAADWRKAVERVIHMLREPFEVVPGALRKLSASVGCALYPQDASHVSRLLGLAEAALFSHSERELQRRGEQLDPYGAQAAENMAWLQRFIGPHLPRLSEELLHALRLLESPGSDTAAAATRQPVADLAPQLEHYVEMLLAPDLRREQHRLHALHMGRLQAALGVPPQAGVCELGRLYRRLAGLTQRIPTRLSERMLFLGTLMQRIEADLSFQHEGAEQLREELLERVRELATAMQRTRRRADLLDVIVQSLQELPFMAWCAAYTQDARGRFVLESQSTAHEAWRAASPGGAFEDGQPLGDNTLARSWLRSDIEAGPDVPHAARIGRGWALHLLEHGVRSSVAVPVLDAAGHVLVVLKLYGQLPASLFGTTLMRHALDSLRFFMAAELGRVGEDVALPAVAADERAKWRQRLFGGGLRMMMQPIVDLRLQGCTRVEALARLQLDDSVLVPPARFLPILGQHELDRLFLDGLNLSLQALRAWERDGVRLDLALNLPPATLRHAECVQWVRSALTHAGIDPRRLSLEILEDRDVASQATMRSATEQLRALGVRLALDDLGAGYSSLLRLNSLPFDMVKVDQGLVHGIVANNPRAVPLVTGLVDLARRLELGVTIEGLETQILLEYAQYLRADFGQGHAISPAMPPQHVPAWVRGWRMPPLSGITPFAAMTGSRARGAGS